MGLTIGNKIGIGKVQLGAGLNQIDEALLADNIYLVTEEGYLIVEQDNTQNILISEDLL